MLRIIVQRAGEVVADFTSEALLVTIGRASSNDLCIDDPVISSRHLVVKANRTTHNFLLIDQSAEGVFVDGAPVGRRSFDKPIVATTSPFEFTFIPQQGEASLAAGSTQDAIQTTENDELQTRPFELAALHADAELRLISPVASSETTIVFSESAMIGRSAECDLRVDGREISRRHCVVFRSGAGFTIRRLSKLNMVWVNDQELAHEESTSLRDADIIRVASQELLFLYPATSAPAATSDPSGDASPNVDLHVERRLTRDRSVAAFDVIGFLGIKTFPKLEAAILPTLPQLDRVIVDLGYLIGVDGHGVQSLARMVSEADRCAVGIQFIRVPPRVGDILLESPLRKLLQPFIASNEESAIRRLRREVT